MYIPVTFWLPISLTVIFTPPAEARTLVLGQDNLREKQNDGLSSSLKMEGRASKVMISHHIYFCPVSFKHVEGAGIWNEDLMVT